MKRRKLCFFCSPLRIAVSLQDRHSWLCPSICIYAEWTGGLPASNCTQEHSRLRLESKFYFPSLLALFVLHSGSAEGDLSSHNSEEIAIFSLNLVLDCYKLGKINKILSWIFIWDCRELVIKVGLPFLFCNSELNCLEEISSHQHWSSKMVERKGCLRSTVSAPNHGEYYMAQRSNSR